MITIKSLPVNQKALSLLITSDASGVKPVDINFSSPVGRLKPVEPVKPVKVGIY
jgi:hypothetical protein